MYQKKTTLINGIVVFIAIIGVLMVACNDPVSTESDLPVLGGTVTINGSALVGQTLTANTTALGGSGIITFQWSRGGTVVGTNSSTYIVQAADAGAAITVTVTRSDNSGSVTGEPTAPIRPMPLPIEMVRINAGTFTMGSPTSETGRDSDETQRQVTLSSFWMGKYEVTQEQYQAVMGVNPSWFHGGSGRESATGEIQGRRPVETVTWYDAVEFCNKLSEREGLTLAYTITSRIPATGYPITSATVTVDWNASGYRLPTEAEWEYACRAGTTTAYHTGDTISDNTGWYSVNSGDRTHEVGKKAANAWGLYDMHGNVWEWCWDWYGTYASGAQTDPRGPSSGSSRVLRGGSWYGDAQSLRSAFRIHNYPSDGYYGISFRLVRPNN